MGDKRLIDVETGEDLTHLYSLRSRKQDEAYRKKLEQERYKSANTKRWVASYHDPIRAVIKDLSLIEAGAIVKLLPYLRFKSDGQLISGGKPLKQADIQRIIGKSRRATNTILGRLEALGIIKVVQRGRSNEYYISAEFHTMGDTKEGASFTKLYQVKTNEIIADLGLSEIGLLYKILPFFHFSEYYLCANPDEENPEVIEHLGRDQLAKEIGHDRDTVTASIAKLQRKGAILSTKSGRTVRYLVHPDVMFRQTIETDWTQSVRKMFAQHRADRK
ncbi:helix-turn-helix transcriptional regulator [Bacillus sp. LR_5]|uniref:helix-turn-helix transcriptional regulator n=1 Tax=Bacillus sp. LR_5 TaxID=3055784 RepID=UPI00365E1E7D